MNQKKKATLIGNIRQSKELYILIVPVVLFYLLFHYKPMGGAIIAFKDFSPVRGIWKSPWVGFKHFASFFESPYFFRVLFNTLHISVISLVFSFPMPIVLAILVNEIHNKLFASAVKTISYLPHFISLVVICGMIKDFTSNTGVITQLLKPFGFPQETMLSNPKLFVPIYVISGIWQQVGWSSIIYIAALAGIDQEMYEAARIDGANRLKQIWHITLPCLKPTILILLILALGGLMSIGYEKIILLYNPAIYETADVISSYVYRKGLLEFNFSFSSAVGLFNSAINFAILVAANKISAKVGESSLW